VHDLLRFEVHSCIVLFHKISIPSRWVIGHPRGRRVSKEPKLEFLEAWGVSNQKTLCGRGMDIFWNNTL